MDNSDKTARAHRALSFFYALISCVALLVFAFGGGKDKGVLLLVVVLFAGLFALHRAVANAAKLKKPWARKASIVIGVLALPGVPVGTIIGVLLLSYAWKPWASNA